MGIMLRLKNLLGAKLENGIEVLENPRDMLDYSLVKMENGLQAITKNIVEFGTAKKRVELQRDTLRASICKYAEQAEKALVLGQEDLAKEAVIREVLLEQREIDLTAQIAKMAEQLQAISKSQDDLRREIQNFRSKKEELKATYAASQAQLKVKELVTSIGSESENIGRTVERAQVRIQDMQAKVQAIDELEDQGVITKVFSDGQDDIEHKLKRMSINSAVDAELAKLKAGLAVNS